MKSGGFFLAFEVAGGTADEIVGELDENAGQNALVLLTTARLFSMI